MKKELMILLSLLQKIMGIQLKNSLRNSQRTQIKEILFDIVVIHSIELLLEDI